MPVNVDVLTAAGVDFAALLAIATGEGDATLQDVSSTSTTITIETDIGDILLTGQNFVGDPIFGFQSGTLTGAYLYPPDTVINEADPSENALLSVEGWAIDLPPFWNDVRAAYFQSNAAAAARARNTLESYAYDFDGNAGADVFVGGDLGDNISGLGGNDTLFGNDGDDILNGGGGADSLVGGDGSDLYIVNAQTDVVVERATGDRDRVISVGTYKLLANAEVEVLQTSAIAGTAAIDLTGSNTNNAITGNAGVNRLAGLRGNDVLNGSLGNDVLNGGLGLDSFLFNSALGPAENVDSILAFSHADDTILLSKSVFGAVVGTGRLTQEQFALANQAVEDDDRIIYDAGTGTLFYDVDGGARTNAIAFAQIANPNTAGLAFNDFVVVA